MKIHLNTTEVTSLITEGIVRRLNKPAEMALGVYISLDADETIVAEIDVPEDFIVPPEACIKRAQMINTPTDFNIFLKQIEAAREELANGLSNNPSSIQNMSQEPDQKINTSALGQTPQSITKGNTILPRAEMCRDYKSVLEDAKQREPSGDNKANP